MALSSSGVLSGTPTVSGFYNINLRLTDSVGTVYNGVSLNVYDVQITTPGVLPNATQFAPYAANVTATGGTATAGGALSGGCRRRAAFRRRDGDGQMGVRATATDTNPSYA
jgi:hypothetical protein